MVKDDGRILVDRNNHFTIPHFDEPDCVPRLNLNLFQKYLLEFLLLFFFHGPKHIFFCHGCLRLVIPYIHRHIPKVCILRHLINKKPPAIAEGFLFPYTDGALIHNIRHTPQL